jgi:hypothetical protein
MHERAEAVAADRLVKRGRVRGADAGAVILKPPITASGAASDEPTE